MARADNYSDWTASLFAPYVKGRVLEVGCGVGTYTRLLVERCSPERLMSIDISSDAIEHCRTRLRHPIVEFKCTDVLNVSGEFDTIVCMNVLEHIADDRSALRHMMEMLRPRGTLFLLVPAHNSFFTPWDDASGHFRRYSKRDVRAMISEVPDSSRFQVTQYYFNAIGGLGHFFVFQVLGKAPTKSVAGEIGFFDKWIVPVMRRIEGRRTPFGISLVSVVVRED